MMLRHFPVSGDDWDWGRLGELCQLLWRGQGCSSARHRTHPQPHPAKELGRRPRLKGRPANPGGRPGGSGTPAQALQAAGCGSLGGGHVVTGSLEFKCVRRPIFSKRNEEKRRAGYSLCLGEGEDEASDGPVRGGGCRRGEEGRGWIGLRGHARPWEVSACARDPSSQLMTPSTLCQASSRA